MRDVITIMTPDSGFIRGVQLRRRRSRVPWIYALYHVARPKLGNRPARVRPWDGRSIASEL